MLNKLSEIEKKLLALEYDLSSPAVLADGERYLSLHKEYKAILPIVEKYRAYVSCEKRVREAEEMLSDPLLFEEAEIEYKREKSALSAIMEEIKILLLPKDPHDDKNIMVEIRACAGGEEAALFAYDLYRMYTMYAASVGDRIEIVTQNVTDLGGIKEIVFSVIGDGAYSRYKWESGVHRVQRVPVTESQGRIQTSTVSVAVLPEVDEVEVEIKPSDLEITTCKSSGAGGQHVNKTESAIRILHKPTGMVVECQEERSQYKNKDKAMALLRSRLYRIKEAEQTSRVAEDRRRQVGSGDRSEKIRTYNFPQNRVTDHRIGMTIYHLDSYLNGSIGEMVDALRSHETAEKLKGETV